MASNRRIQVSDLDFDQIRANLKTFMQGQETFSDYNFDGSALSVLLDVLAYNTHYNALYTNLAVNEMFLDSASKRSSAVSIANNFGYIPKSATAARATLAISVLNPSATAQTLTIPKWSPFSTMIDNQSYTFYTIQDYTANLSNGAYVFPYVEIFEGSPRSLTFVCTELNQKFTIPYKDIDLSTLSVTVQSTGENPDYSRYTVANRVLSLNAESEVYFVKELEDETYQIWFGSNNLGKPLAAGNVVSVQGLLTNKAQGNGASIFTYTGTGLGGTVVPSVVSAAFGGEEKESLDEIKYNVTQSFFDQNRCVTPVDFMSVIKRYYEDVDSVIVWGGEDNAPPVYGKVFISVKPANKAYLTPAEENYIKETILEPRSVVSVTPEFVRPSYIELEIDTTVYYNKSVTTRSADNLKAAITQTIQDYRNTNLKKFDGVFRMSKFSAAIDAVDPSIQSNITRLKAYIEVAPKYNSYAEYRLNLVNPIYSEGVPEEAFSSTGFYIDDTDNVYYLDDDGVGNIRLFRKIEGTGERVIQNAKIGSIDYSTGTVKISNLRITSLFDANMYFIIKTASFDVVSIRNQIVDIPAKRVTVSLIEDSIAAGTMIGGTNYKFTASRS